MRMHHAALVVGTLTISGSAALMAQQGATPPARTAPAGMNWAYAIAPAPAAAPATGGARAGGAGGAAPAPDPTPRQLPGSALQYTAAQIRDFFGPADWYPQDHPPMPDIVGKGRRPEARACAMCHMPNGKGRPENAGVAGLPVEYFVQTMNDFRSGARASAESRKGNTNLMIQIAKAMTPEEIKAAADYFGSMRWTPWITVKETARVPVMRSQAGMWIPVEPEMTEPIGTRVIETPTDVERTEQFRDPRSGFIAYVPVGSVRKGEALVVRGGNGRTVACGGCHGTDLQGLGPVPGLAGRSPSYLARQMYDMKAGARRGTWSALMGPVVERLTDEDYVNIAAYLASRPASAASVAR